MHGGCGGCFCDKRRGFPELADLNNFPGSGTIGLSLVAWFLALGQSKQVPSGPRVGEVIREVVQVWT